MRYRFTGDAPVLIADLHRVVSPGEEFDSDLFFSPDVAELVEQLTPSPADLDVSGPEEAA